MEDAPIYTAPVATCYQPSPAEMEARDFYPAREGQYTGWWDKYESCRVVIGRDSVEIRPLGGCRLLRSPLAVRLQGIRDLDVILWALRLTAKHPNEQ